MRKHVALAMTLPLLAAPLLVASPASAASVVKEAKLEKSIKKGFKKQAGIRVKVNCPSEVKWAKGKVFYCTAKNKATGGKYRVQVTLGNESKGKLNWKVVS